MQPTFYQILFQNNSDVNLAEELVKKERKLRKDLIKKLNLDKKRIKLLATASGVEWALAMERFSSGMYYSYSEKFYNDELCKSWEKNL